MNELNKKLVKENLGNNKDALFNKDYGRDSRVFSSNNGTASTGTLGNGNS